MIENTFTGKTSVPFPNKQYKHKAKNGTNKIQPIFFSNTGKRVVVFIFILI